VLLSTNKVRCSTIEDEEMMMTLKPGLRPVLLLNKCDLINYQSILVRGSLSKLNMSSILNVQFRNRIIRDSFRRPRLWAVNKWINQLGTASRANEEVNRGSWISVWIIR